MKHERTAAVVAAGLLLAQMSSYNGGIPITSGTQVPESNPATAISAWQPAATATSPAAAPAIAPPAASTAPSGPAYSFGAAPAPVLSTPASRP